MNKIYFPLLGLFFIILGISCASDDKNTGENFNFPSFGAERVVSINGLTFDAMEPFISPDGTYLLFNNLNDGTNTRLYYAVRVNDSVFDFAGELNGPNQTNPPHLDAVPDLDADGNFYWTSTRNYPAELNNLFRGSFTNGVVNNIGRVQGDFYKNTSGWLVMDHGISTDGQFLYYNNARFDSSACQGPCETELGIAERVNDFEFRVLSNEASILQNINDSNYIYYAPCISSDGLELYFTRYRKGQITPETQIEICVAVRTDLADVFSEPRVLFSDVVADIIEAPTLTVDKQIMYYHRKIAGTHMIVMRNRN
ncbi:hypothetical protein [Robiginitalea sp. IMCC43444]|uniref:hypothetical protein n=1 Tax=Robiginitalea sp. IMCC43444 TaxID=3459121 RepID=UPI0040415DAC